jgi:hypothetical protein
MSRFSSCIFAALLLAPLAALHAAAVANLRCEYRENPLGIDVAKPRLSRWQGQTYTIHLSLTSQCGFIAGDTNHIVQRVPPDRLDLPPID